MVSLVLVSLTFGLIVAFGLEVTSVFLGTHFRVTSEDSSFTGTRTISGLLVTDKPRPLDLLRGVIVLPLFTRRVTFGVLLRL